MPAVEKAGWDLMSQIRQEVKLRAGKVIVRGQLGMRKLSSLLILSCTISLIYLLL